MGFEWAEQCKHVQFGLLHLADSKMSTREGNVVFLEDVLDKSVELAMNAIDEKNPDLGDRQEVAEAVGVGSIIFGDIVKRRAQDITFKWDEILNFDGETAPYVQYTHARAGSILRKADFMQSMGPGPEYVPNDAEFELIKLFCSYDDKIDEAKKEYEPFVIARYVLDIARSFNRFYYQEKIIDVEDVALRDEKLFIVYSIKELIKQNLAILGIRAPERM
jgi:arginyl-tRNA synthetase